MKNSKGIEMLTKYEIFVNYLKIIVVKCLKSEISTGKLMCSISFFWEHNICSMRLVEYATLTKVLLLKVKVVQRGIISSNEIKISVFKVRGLDFIGKYNSCV